MSKSPNRWVLLFCISVLILAGMFSYYEIKDHLKQPSKNWSRALLLGKVDHSDINGSTRTRVTTVAVPKENMFITFWNDRTSLHYGFVDNNGHVLKTNKIQTHFDEPIILKAVLSDNSQIHIYSLENRTLNRYVFDYKSEKLAFHQTVAKGVKQIQQFGGKLFLSGDNGVKSIGYNQANEILTTHPANAADIFVDHGNITRLAYITTDNAGVRHLYYTFGINGKYDKNSIEIGQIMVSSGEFDSVDSLIIGRTGDLIQILIPIRSYVNQSGRIVIYSFYVDTPHMVQVAELNQFYEYNPNPIYISKDGDSIDFFAAKPVTLGARAKTINLYRFTLTDSGLSEKEMLTKLKNYSINPNYVKLGDYEYIQWENIEKNSTKIMFAGTAPPLVQLASKAAPNDLFDKLMDCIVAMLFSLISTIAVCPVILIPSVLIVGTISLLYLNWVESNSNTVTIWIIRIHTITEMLFTWYLFRKNAEFMSLAPQLLQNTIVLYLLIFFICLIPYYCMRMRYKDRKKDNTFLYQYSFYVLINFVLYSLLVFPWGYI